MPVRIPTLPILFRVGRRLSKRTIRELHYHAHEASKRTSAFRPGVRINPTLPNEMFAPD